MSATASTRKLWTVAIDLSDSMEVVVDVPAEWDEDQVIEAAKAARYEDDMYGQYDYSAYPRPDHSAEQYLKPKHNSIEILGEKGIDGWINDPEAFEAWRERHAVKPDPKAPTPGQIDIFGGVVEAEATS